ncbi:hypothetical protein KIN20_030477 [Parelaphostrongylus tenuis]|uniref:Uncharacterized protein n=1 Tax=Parelaphostrongylus tenuis TaxID=148309 RepID=A0AAD5R436_PARTN|nr:hypothetical protein KIN20_030477 [Parelaphostrongylus tenuis]
MGDSQNPSNNVVPTESDDQGITQDSVIQDSSSTETGNHPYSSALLHHFDYLITNVAKRYDIERIQVGLGLLLLILLGFFCLCIAIAWKYYSPVIVDFTIREQQERLYRRNEKERQEKEIKVE